MSCLLEAVNAPKFPAVVLFGGGAAYEILLTSMVFSRLFRAVRQGDSRVASIIVNNGLVYFTIVTMLCATEFFLFAILPDSKLLIPTGLASLLESVGSVFACRLMLQLRAYVHHDYDSGGEFTSMSMSVNPTQPGSIKFADRSQSASGQRTSRSHTKWEDLEFSTEERELATAL